MDERKVDPVIEQPIRCPYCDEIMEIVIDLSAGDQSYVEDCEVCCQPMQVTFQTANLELLGLQVERGS